VQLLPHPRLLPVAQAPPAGRSRSVTHLLGEHLPGDAALFKTKTMPVRAARSLMRGLPPLGFVASGGNSGSMTFHSSSLTSSLLMPTSVPSTHEQVLQGALRRPAAGSIANPGEGQRVSVVTVPPKLACERLEPPTAAPGTGNEHECGHGRASLVSATMK
jgi:hypothetical protein